MTKLSSGQKVQKRLVENITLLWTLCEIPGRPKENKLGGGQDGGRQLPWDRERQLVDSFAFISASTDDMLRVMAVCIEEDPDKEGMTVRLASNTGDLSDVTRGFNGIARSLEQATWRKKSRVDVQQDVFRQIVTLDDSRILSRLRSNHAKKTQKTRGKPELLPLLNRTVHDESIISRNAKRTTLITSIRSSTRGLAQRFSDFEETRGSHGLNSVSQDVLVELLMQIDKFDVAGLETVLATSSMIDPSLKAYLPQAMRKIGRYFRIACDLVNAARNPGYTIFQRISIQPTEKPHFDMEFMADHSVDFDRASQRVTGSSRQHLLNAYGSQSLLAARMKFQSRMSDCPVPWKVHAEIQLLLFYEQQPHASRPRIIGSSKSACYLCDLFIHTHGQFRVPRTHGRLYDRWILPKQAANGHLLSVIDRFNAALEAKIKQSLRRRTRSLPHPNESVLLLRQPWPSNSTLAEPNEQASIQEIDTLPGDQSRPLCDTSPHDQASIPETVNPIHDIPSVAPTQPPPNTPPRSPFPSKTSPSQDQPVVQTPADNIQPAIHPHPSSPIIHRLHLGSASTRHLILPHETFIIEAGPLRLHASCDSPSPSRPCWIHVQWSQATVDHDDDESDLTVDVDALATDHDTTVDAGAGKELALRSRGDVVLVRFSFVE